MKKCSTCDKEKDESEFGKYSRSKDGFNYNCRTCRAKYRLKNKEKTNKKRMEYYYKNKEKTNKELREKYRDDVNFRNKMKENTKSYRKKYPEKKRKMDYAYLKKKRKENVSYRIRDSISANIRARIEKGEKTTFYFLGCSIEEYKQYLEEKFQDGMTWNNYGKWQIDHIKPVSSFDLLKEGESEKCFHYTNTQPLWAFDNLSKGNKIE